VAIVEKHPANYKLLSTGLSVDDQSQESETAKLFLIQDIAEAKRMLYVSMTRAKDLLILPLPENKSTRLWMETLHAKWMVPNGKELTLPNKLIIPSARREYEAKAPAGSKKRTSIALYGAAQSKTLLKNFQQQ